MNKPLIILLIFFSSLKCSHVRNESNVSLSMGTWVGKKIIVSVDTINIKIKNVTASNRATLYKSNNIKLIVAINGDCGVCAYKLKVIENFTEKILSLYKDVSLLVYVNSDISDFLNFEIYNDTEIHFKYPLLYDYENRYLKENNYPSNDYYSVVLCDKNDEVLVIGDFCDNDKLRELYLEKLQKYASPLISNQSF